jgi:hypothetical protein
MEYWHSGHHLNDNSAKEETTNKKATSNEC